jgi:hypothetical protein
MGLNHKYLAFKKNLLTSGFLLIATLGYSQSFMVSSKKYGATLHPNHKNYCWQFEQDSLIPEALYLNDIQLKSDIKKAINEELQNIGYKPNSSSPYMLVKFEVLSSPTRLYEFDRFNSTLQSLVGKNDNTAKANYNVDPGTLIISFKESNTNKISHSRHRDQERAFHVVIVPQLRPGSMAFRVVNKVLFPLRALSLTVPATVFAPLPPTP